MPDALMTTYARLPISFERGSGAWLWNAQGDKYLDAVSGIAVCGLGHAHPAVAEAVCKQAERLVHASNLYEIPLQSELAARLTRLASMDKAFFCNSGAEANESAIKIARLYGHGKNIATPTIIVAENSFHGRTMATLTATGSRKAQAGFEPLVKGFRRVPYNDVNAIRTVAKNTSDVVAVLVEPIQGEGGIQIPDADYLSEIRAICNEQEWLMVLDEIQSGLCRTGDWFAFEHAGVQPDVVTLAKSLGNGVPIGACLARGKAAEVFQPGSHGSTFGGNPLACSAALAVLETMERQELAQRATELGDRMLGGLKARLGGNEHVSDIRGKGLMIGIELDRLCKELVNQALERRLLINITADRVVRLLPPLILNDEEASMIVDTVSDLIEAFVR